jgi:type IV pilus assembly protein PilV
MNNLLTNNTQREFSFNRMKKQQGMTFLEVLIGLVILVTGILGAVAMQVTAKQGSFDAMQRSLASSLAQDIISRMRANAPLINPNVTLAQYAVNNYGAALNALPGNRCRIAAAVPCTALEVATNDMYEWEAALMGADVIFEGKNNGGLVGAAACITQNVNLYTVIVSWQARNSTMDNGINACGTAGSKRRQVVVQSFIFNI